MAGSKILSVSPAPVVEGKLLSVDGQAPRRGRPAKNPDAAPAETTPRTAALKAAKAKIKDLGPLGSTAEVAISKQEMALLTGWQLIMGDITWNEPSYQVTVNGEHLGTFT